MLIKDKIEKSFNGKIGFITKGGKEKNKECVSKVNNCVIETFEDLGKCTCTIALSKDVEANQQSFQVFVVIMEAVLGENFTVFYEKLNLPDFIIDCVAKKHKHVHFVSFEKKGISVGITHIPNNHFFILKIEGIKL